MPCAGTPLLSFGQGASTPFGAGGDGRDKRGAAAADIERLRRTAGALRLSLSRPPCFGRSLSAPITKRAAWLNFRSVFAHKPEQRGQWALRGAEGRKVLTTTRIDEPVNMSRSI